MGSFNWRALVRPTNPRPRTTSEGVDNVLALSAIEGVSARPLSVVGVITFSPCPASNLGCQASPLP